MYGMAVLFWEFSMAVNNLNSNFNYCKTWQNSISNKLVQRYAIAATNGFRNYRRFSLKLFFKPCSKKSIFYFLNNCRKLTDFNYFGMKIWHENHLTDCPSHLSDVATVPWEIQTSHFQQYYSYILLITYTLSHKKKTVIHFSTPPENVTTLTCELQNFFHLTEGLLHSFKRWRHWKEPVVDCDQ